MCVANDDGFERAVQEIAFLTSKVAFFDYRCSIRVLIFPGARSCEPGLSGVTKIELQITIGYAIRQVSNAACLLFIADTLLKRISVDKKRVVTDFPAWLASQHWE